MSREPKEPPRKMGTAKRSESATDNKRIRNRNRGTNAEADISSADAGLLHSVINAVTKRGCAIQFGYTKDGGAVVIRIVGDGDPYNEYVRATEDIDTYLQGLLLDFE